MDIKLRRVVEHPALSKKAMAYSGILYINKIQIAFVHNDGKGVKTNITAYNDAAFATLLEAQVYLRKSMPPEEDVEKLKASTLSQVVDNLAAEQIRKLNEKTGKAPENAAASVGYVEKERTSFDQENDIRKEEKMEKIKKRGKLSAKFRLPGNNKSRHA